MEQLIDDWILGQPEEKIGEIQIKWIGRGGGQFESFANWNGEIWVTNIPNWLSVLSLCCSTKAIIAYKK